MNGVYTGQTVNIIYFIFILMKILYNGFKILRKRGTIPLYQHGLWTGTSGHPSSRFKGEREAGILADLGLTDARNSTSTSTGNSGLIFLVFLFQYFWNHFSTKKHKNLESSRHLLDTIKK